MRLSGLCVLAVAMLAGNAAAQTPSAVLTQCRAIVDERARLQCYDRLVNQAPAAGAMNAPASRALVAPAVPPHHALSTRSPAAMPEVVPTRAPAICETMVVFALRACAWWLAASAATLEIAATMVDQFGSEAVAIATKRATRIRSAQATTSTATGWTWLTS